VREPRAPSPSQRPEPAAREAPAPGARRMPAAPALVPRGMGNRATGLLLEAGGDVAGVGSAGAGVNYYFSPALVLKLENHWDKGIQVEQPASPLDPPRFHYFIASLSASF